MRKFIICAMLMLSLAGPAFSQVQPTQVLGDFNPSSTFQCYFTTFRYDTGAPIVLAGTPAVKVYKDGDTTSEVSTGLTLNVSFDSVVGLNEIDVDTSNAFYAVGHDYTIFISTGTVNAVSVVGFAPCRFSIGRGVNLKYVNGGSTGTSAGKLNLAQLKITATGSDNALDIISDSGATLKLTPTSGRAFSALGQFSVEPTQLATVAVVFAGANGDGSHLGMPGLQLLNGSDGGFGARSAVEAIESTTGAELEIGTSTGDVIKLTPAGSGIGLNAVTSALGIVAAKNVALANVPFLMLSTTNGTALTGLTSLTCNISKDGAAFASCSGSVSEVGLGFYKVSLTQTEMNANVVLVVVSKSGAVPARKEIRTEP